MQAVKLLVSTSILSFVLGVPLLADFAEGVHGAQARPNLSKQKQSSPVKTAAKGSTKPQAVKTAKGSAPNKAKSKRTVAHHKSKHKRAVNPNKVLAKKIAKNAAMTAQTMNSKGLCYRGVKRAVKPLGIELHGYAAYKAVGQLKNDKRFRVVARSVKQEKLKKGDIVVHDRSEKHPFGHIAVYLGNGLEASDHIQKLVIGKGYGGTTVFRPVTPPSENS